ncbi:MAG TPA: hypothetical protein VFQ76_20045 [Longimicrobiaceae bacterium]|nr:hypothetical protein [Longimicrobiaceae bacterium]
MENTTRKLVLGRQTLRNLTPEKQAPSVATRLSDNTVTSPAPDTNPVSDPAV